MSLRDFPGEDTSLGGSDTSFPSTVWSEILAASLKSPEAQSSFDRLARRYWRPIYAYIRAAFRKSNEEAKDLTQAFFAHILEGSFLQKVREDKGTFRAYLKRSLRNFVIDAERHAAVRRPSTPLLSLDRAMRHADMAPMSPDESPEEAYDRTWFRTVLDRAVDRLWRFLCAEGRPRSFEIFSLYCLGPITSPDGFKAVPVTGSLTYKDVATRLGVTETEVRGQIEYCRAHLRKYLEEVIREYSCSEEEVREELKQIPGFE